MQNNTGIVNLKGKDYQTVALRVQLMRKEHPEWAIITDVLHCDNERVMVKAAIITETGRTIATGHAEEYRGSSPVNKTSAIENCETSAIGRCLAAAGWLGGGEFASADEVARAVSGAKQEAPKLSPLQAAEKWALEHAVELETAGLWPKWNDAIKAAKMDDLRAIKAQIMGGK